METDVELSIYKGSGQNFGLLVVVNKVCDFSEISFTDKGLL